MADRASPAALGFSMPAEWEPHAATWIGWPHNASDWPGKLAAIQWVYGEIVRKLAPGEPRTGADRRGPSSRGVLAAPDEPRVDARLRAHVRATGPAPCGGRDRAVPLQCLGQIPRLEERRSGPRARRAPAQAAVVPSAVR